MKKTLLGLILSLLFVIPLSVLSVQATTSFTDIEGHWAEQKILQAVNDGYISGYPDNTFRPDDNITRAEFASVIARATAVNEEVVDFDGFDDVPST
uniref:S-layer homology domain-containing protein n=1 Tax=Longirhabdus pacifica TaxID=2305227 RepID=UPI0013E8E097